MWISGDSNYPMLSIDDIPPSFLEQHRLCCRRLMNWQASTILSNIASFQVPLDSGATNRLQQLKRNLTIGYVGRFCLRPIDHSQHVVPNPHNQVCVAVTDKQLTSRWCNGYHLWLMRERSSDLAHVADKFFAMWHTSLEWAAHLLQCVCRLSLPPSKGR